MSENGEDGRPVADVPDDHGQTPAAHPDEPRHYADDGEGAGSVTGLEIFDPPEGAPLPGAAPGQQPSPQYPQPPEQQAGMTHGYFEQQHVQIQQFEMNTYPAEQPQFQQQYPIPPHGQQYPQGPQYPQPQQETYPPQDTYPAQDPQGQPHPPQQGQYPAPDGFQQMPPSPPQNVAPAQAPSQNAVPPQNAVPQQAPPPMPAPEDLLVSGRVVIPPEPATWGWRGKVNRGSGGLFKPKPGTAELAARTAIKRIQRSFSRPMTVVVVQPKGGAGKTPTTVCLSAAFGAHRGGYVVGWDDNETRGTLAVRVNNPDNQQATVWDLLSDLPAFERYDARVGDLSFYVRAQPDAHFDALVSDDNPANMAQIGDEAFQRLHTVLQRFYRVIVVDTGNNVRSPNWQAAVNAADQVVVVSTYQRDVGFSGSWVLDHLAQTGREELARNAVTILTAADPTVDKEVREQLVSHFTARTRAVTEIPYDVELAHGGPIRWSHLAPATRNAWVEAGAIVVDALSEHDDRTLAERRS